MSDDESIRLQTLQLLDRDSDRSHEYHPGMDKSNNLFDSLGLDWQSNQGSRLICRTTTSQRHRKRNPGRLANPDSAVAVLFYLFGLTPKSLGFDDAKA